MFQADPALCIKDGICMRSCPANIIAMDEHSGLPFVIKGDEDLCIRCGHCVLHCPTTACSLDFFTEQAEFRPVELPSEDSARAFLISRRSTRCFQDKPVPRRKIESILEAARYAPSASNRQLVRWVVSNQPDTTQKVKSLYLEWLSDLIKQGGGDRRDARRLKLLGEGIDPIFRGAPQFVAALVPGDFEWNGDAVIATTYFELAAHAADVGTCWGGLLIRAIRGSEAIRRLLGIEENERVEGLLLFGYPALPLPHILPPRKQINVTFR